LPKKLESIVNLCEKKVKYLTVDGGAEFAGACIKNVYQKYNIKRIVTRNFEIKSALAERFIKNWKSVLYKYFHSNNTLRYIEVLPSIIKNYNNQVHSSTGLTPNEVVSSLEKQKIAFKNLFEDKIMQKYAEPKFSLGDLVRISKYKNPLTSKGYEMTFSEEIYKISKIIKTRIPTYELTSLAGTKIKGTFLAQELTVGTQSEVYKIDRVIRTKGTGRNKQALVSWRGWHKEHNSWIPFSDIKNLK
jgi:hypothetical protein